MAYTKTNWVDRVVDGSGAVIVEGTPVNATNMNKIEQAIEDLQGKAYKISLPVSSWTGSGPYTYVYSATGMTSDTTIDYTVDSTISNLNGDLTITTGVGTITFSTPALPSGTVTVTVMAVGVDADIQLIDWSSYCYSKDQAVAKTDIVNSLTSTATNKPLSAAKGKELNDNYYTGRIFSTTVHCVYLNSTQLVGTLSTPTAPTGYTVRPCFARNLIHNDTIGAKCTGGFLFGTDSSSGNQYIRVRGSGFVKTDEETMDQLDVIVYWEYMKA